MQVFHSYKNKLLTINVFYFEFQPQHCFQKKNAKNYCKPHLEMCNYVELENLPSENDLRISRIPIGLPAVFIMRKYASGLFCFPYSLGRTNLVWGFLFYSTEYTAYSCGVPL